MPRCGSQVILCDLPIRFDTYKGCGHGCKYCFVQRNRNELSNIALNESADSLKKFIQGYRTRDTEWCDWDIPIHWGGESDPFQPIEKKIRASYKCLKVLAETQYPFVVSTKGKLITEPEYLKLISQCNCVVQISMVCASYDVLEKGAPTYAERLKMVETLAKKVPRVIVRIQPYMTQVFNEVKDNIKQLADAGAYGIVVEGMKFVKKKDGLVKIGGDFCYPEDLLKRHFTQLKNETHANGLKFYCGENRLRTMGDSMCCCGIDGLEGFKGNTYNLCHILNGKEYEVTPAMQNVGSTVCFRCLYQNSVDGNDLKKYTFEQQMKRTYKKSEQNINKIFGVK